MIWVRTKSSDCTAGVQFVYHKYDYRLNWMTQSLNQLINDKYNFQKKKRIAKFWEKGKICIKRLDKRGVNCLMLIECWFKP